MGGVNRPWHASFQATRQASFHGLPPKTRNATTEQRLDPARLDHFITVLKLPKQMHSPLRGLAEREAKAR